MIVRLGVIGDVHAECERLEQAISYLKTQMVDAIVCTGDIVDGSGCPDTSARLLKDHDIHTVRGNHDRWLLQDKARHVPNAHGKDALHGDTLSYLAELPATIELDTIAGRLLLCHGVANNDLGKVWPGTERLEIERSRELDTLIASGKHHYVINGHMHFRTIIHFETLTLINAGTLKGVHWPGFSLIDFESLEVTAYEFSDDSIALSRKHPLHADHYERFPDTQSFSGNWEPVRLF